MKYTDIKIVHLCQQIFRIEAILKKAKHMAHLNGYGELFGT